MSQALPPDYENEWCDRRQRASRRSADAIAPFVKDLVSPESIVDLGCRTGSWLAAFGVEDVLGVDVTRSFWLELSDDHFRQHDLRNAFATDRTFDLALCIEVGEHLAESSAQTLVDSLVALAPVVLFSAAVPYQGGTRHLNEQWPDWWARIFSERDYAAVDCLRSVFWNHPDVRYFHAQNLILYVRRDQLAALALEETAVLPLVHPRLYKRALGRFPIPGTARLLPAARFVGRSLGLKRTHD